MAGNIFPSIPLATTLCHYSIFHHPILLLTKFLFIFFFFLSETKLKQFPRDHVFSGQTLRLLPLQFFEFRRIELKIPSFSLIKMATDAQQQWWPLCIGYVTKRKQPVRSIVAPIIIICLCLMNRIEHSFLKDATVKILRL